MCDEVIDFWKMLTNNSGTVLTKTMVKISWNLCNQGVLKSVKKVVYNVKLTFFFSS